MTIRRPGLILFGLSLVLSAMGLDRVARAPHPFPSTGLKDTWQHGGSVPARYQHLLRELRTEIAARPGLERRARRVNHELDTITLGR